MVKVVLIDDEVHALNELEYLLKKEKEIEILASYTDPVLALQEINVKKPDAVILDIDMPVLNGLNAAKEIAEMNGCIDIIFVTAFNEYAVKAFEVNAMDYILKPVDNDRLKKSVARLLTPRRTDTGSKNSILDKIDHVEKYFKMNSEKLVAIDSDEIIMVKTSDIFYLEAQLKEIIIMTRHGKYVSRENLSQWEEKLKDYGFFRCHRSYIVNIKHINKISPMFNNNYIIKQEGTPLEIPISRNHVRELKDLLGV